MAPAPFWSRQLAGPVDAYRAQARAEGHTEIPPERIQSILNSLRENLVELDLKPFACALAEINLLVQVLDLVAHAHRHGEPARLEQIRIFATDTLRVLPAARAVLEGGLDPSEAEACLTNRRRPGLACSPLASTRLSATHLMSAPTKAQKGFCAIERQVEENPILEPLQVLTQKWQGNRLNGGGSFRRG